MNYTATTAVRKIASLSKRLKIIQGGSSAGKTIAILLILIDKAQSNKNKLISVVSETMPHLKRGAIRDFLSIMENHEYFNEESWNRTDLIYTFPSGSRIEFFSADQPGKVRGPRRDILFGNEINNISFETYTQLAIRTRESIYLDYNPVGEFWVHEYMRSSNDYDFIILNYKDNDALSESIVKELESRKDNKNWWLVYGLGQLGNVEGKIYTNWAIIDDIPHEARLERYGLDFGYSVDPTALVAVYYYNGGYILDEITYQKGLSNKQIADIINNYPKAMVVADSAEPKSIDDIKMYGSFVVPAQKGQGSITRGISHVQSFPISVTKRSVNVIREYRNYMWKTMPDGRLDNEHPEPGFDHSMDAIRYAIGSIRDKVQKKEPELTLEEQIRDRIARRRSMDEDPSELF